MTDQTPKEAGFYWAKFRSLDWTPVEVYLPTYGPPLQVFVLGGRRSVPLDSFTWGPRITLPDELEGVK